MSLKDHAGVALSPRPSRFGPLLFAGRLEQGLEQASALGFPYVELSIRGLDDVQPQELNQKLGELNLKISALATGQACLFDCLCLGSDHDQKRANAVTHFKGITRLAKDIHSEAVIIGGIRGLLAGDGETREQNYAKAVASIRECALYTDELGIQLLIEPINRYEMNWILTAREGLQFLDDVGVASVKLLLDTFHMNIEEADSLAAFEQTGKRLGYVHFADNIRQAPGSGQINFDAILNKLEEMDYRGPVVAEILPLPDDQTAIRKTAAFWQQR
jgi:sugar phosphate isomerase/epimerase